MAFREVRVEPDLDPAISVNTDKVLLWTEVAYKVEQFFKPIQAAEQNIEILGIWNVLDIAHPGYHMLDINPGIVACVAKLFGLLRVNEFSVDNIILTLAPLEEFDVLFVLSLVVEIYLVLLNLFSGKVVAIEVGQPVLWTVVGSVRGHEVPVFTLKGGGLIRF